MRIELYNSIESYTTLMSALQPQEVSRVETRRHIPVPYGIRPITEPSPLPE